MFKIDSKTYPILAVALIIGICLGFFFGSLAKNRAYEMGLMQGQAETKAKYQKKIEEIFPPSPEPENLYSVSGKVTRIEGQTLTLAVTLPAFNPLEDPEIVTMVVKLSGAAEVVREIPKSPDKLAAEEQAFFAGERETPPSLYDEETADFSEIKVGDNVGAESEENIKGKTTFEAKKIVLTSD